MHLCKKELRKESILDRAITVFSKRGYRNTDVQKIADALDIGKGTIYRHFPSKEALFQACCDKAMRQLQVHIDSKISEYTDPISRITLGMQAYICFFKKHPKLIELFVHERAEFKTRKFSTYLSERIQENPDWKERFEKLQDQGKVRKADPETILESISNILYGIIFTKFFQEDETSFEIHAKASLEMILFGIFLSPTPEGAS